MLNITRITQSQQSQPVKTCEDCFTGTLSEDQIPDYIEAFDDIVGDVEITTLQQVCDIRDSNQGISDFNEVLRNAA